MLSITSPIQARDIAQVTELARATVFELQGWSFQNNQPEKIVVKRERNVHHRDFLEANFEFAQAAAPGDPQIALTAGEVNALLTWIQNERGRLPHWADTTDLDHFDVEVANNPDGWIKMPLRRFHKLSDVARATGGGQAAPKSDVRAFAEALSQADGLERFGRVLAADLFNGSRDRFDPDNPGTLDDTGHRYKALTNEGNVFLVDDPRFGARPAALDTYDPNSPFRDTRSPDVQAQEFGGDRWPGRLLEANAARRLRDVLRRVVDDLVWALGPRDRKIPFASTARLPAEAVDRLGAGIRAGAQDLRTMLTAWRATPPARWTAAHGGGLSPLFLDRMALLGW